MSNHHERQGREMRAQGPVRPGPLVTDPDLSPGAAPDTDELRLGEETTTESLFAKTEGLWELFPAGTDQPFRPEVEAARVAGIFLVLAVLWIVFSDQAVVALLDDPVRQAAWQTKKGLVFVLLTGGVIFLLVRGLVLRLERKRRLLSMVSATLSSMIQAVDDVVFTTDREHRLTGLFGRSVHQYGLSRRLMLGHRPSDLLGSHAESFETALGAAISGETIGFESVWQTEGSPRYMAVTLVPLRTREDEIVGALGTCRDVTAHRESEEARRARDIEIIQLGETDPLTGLPNRRALVRRMTQMLNQDAELGTTLGTLAVLDLDHFKLINASHGHHQGDRLLRLIAHGLREILGPGDFVARTGSDEFVVLLNGRAPDNAFRWCADLPRLLQEVSGEDELLPQVRISAGLAPLSWGHDAGHLLAIAEAALFTAKDGGRDRCVLYHSMREARTDLGQASQWLPRIEEALKLDTFELHLQPIVRLDGPQRTTDRFEVLLRLPDGAGGYVLPGEFLPPAERFGWMPRIDRWVVDRAMALLGEHAGLRLFINLSAQSLNDSRLLADLSVLLDDQPDRAERLTLEITESAAIADVEGAIEWMRELRKTGCQFALDDFGSGFSTFEYLRNVPAQYVKLDGAFIRQMEHDVTRQAIVGAMARVCSTLGRTVVAEMVETSDTAALLGAMDITYGQGWLWSRALPAEEAIEGFFRAGGVGTSASVELESTEGA